MGYFVFKMSQWDGEWVVAGSARGNMFDLINFTHNDWIKHKKRNKEVSIPLLFLHIHIFVFTYTFINK